MRPPTWHPGSRITRHRSTSLGVVVWFSLAASRPGLGRATRPTLRPPFWLCQSALAEAGFQPRGEGRVPVAEECLLLAKGRGSWRLAGPIPPPKAGPKDSQLERVEPGERSWKGAEPYERGSLPRAGGALGCHKVNGRRLGVAVRAKAHSLLLRVRERQSGAAARAQGDGPHPGRVPGPRPLPALQTTAATAAAGSLPAAGLTVSV